MSAMLRYYHYAKGVPAVAQTITIFRIADNNGNFLADNNGNFLGE